MGMLQLFSLVTATLGLAAAAPSPIKHVGNVGSILSGGVATKNLVFVSGTTPSINGTIPEGIEAQTAAVIENIATILEKAGTSWDNALKTTVYLASMDDYSAMNEVYGSLLPSPKPARTTIQAGKLPGDFLIEIEAVAAIPQC